MYLEVIECLNVINRSIYGLPAIVAFIVANIDQIIHTFFRRILFPRKYLAVNNYSVSNYLSILSAIVIVILLYGIGDSAEKEVFFKYIIYYTI